MPRALVTGITGQDGWYLSDVLRASGYTVFGMTADDDPAPLPPDVHRVMGDLRSTRAIRSAIAEAEPDEVYNLASLSSVGQSWADPELVADVNGVGVVRLLEAVKACRRPVRFVQAGSAEIFGNSPAPQSERTPVCPVNPYGAAKAFAQHAVNAYRAAGVWAASAIFFNHESPRRPPTFVTRKITAAAVRIAAGAQDRLVLGDLDAQRDWGFAGDYMAAMALIAKHSEPDDFVIATGQSHAVRDFVAAAFMCVGISDWEQHVEVDPGLVRPTETVEQRGDATKAAQLLGWRPSVSFEQLVAMMVGSDQAALADSNFVA